MTTVDTLHSHQFKRNVFFSRICPPQLNGWRACLAHTNIAVVTQLCSEFIRHFSSARRYCFYLLIVNIVFTINSTIVLAFLYALCVFFHLRLLLFFPFSLFFCCRCGCCCSFLSIEKSLIISCSSRHIEMCVRLFIITCCCGMS